MQEGDKVDVNKTVAVAKEAMKRNSEWRTMNPSARGRLLIKIADIIENDIVKIASVEILDNRKRFAAATGDIMAGIACFRYYGGVL